MFSYDYDSGIAFGSGTAKLTEYARHLLTLLKLRRQSDLVNQNALWVSSRRKLTRIRRTGGARLFLSATAWAAF